MRVLDGEQTLVRIFIGEGDKCHHQPLIERCSSGCAPRALPAPPSSTAWPVSGADSVIHTA